MTLQVSLLVDSPGIRRYYLRALRHMLEETDVELALLVINQDPNIPPQTLSGALNRGRVSTASYLRNRFVESPEYMQREELDSISELSDTPRLEVSPTPIKGQLGEELPEATVQEIDSRSDLVLRHGFGVLQGDILTASEHGILSYHHGDIRRYRGVALGFWNFLRDESTAGITLQRLTPELDGGEIIAYREIPIEDCFTWQEVRKRLYLESIPMLAEGIRNLKATEKQFSTPDELGEFNSTSDVYQPRILTKYLIKNSVGRVRRAISVASEA